MKILSMVYISIVNILSDKEIFLVNIKCFQIENKMNFLVNGIKKMDIPIVTARSLSNMWRWENMLKEYKRVNETIETI